MSGDGRAPDVARIDRYRRLRQIELAQSLAGRRRIYLDINYWIELDAVLAGRGQLQHAELLGRLRAAVKSGQAFCPISDVVFLELMKQTDGESRRRLAGLMDELSLGVCLVPHQMLWETEVARFLYAQIPDGPELHPIEDLVWSRAGFILGFMYPTQTVFDRETELLVQRRVFDDMWAAPLTQVKGRIGEAWPAHDASFHDLANQLNRDVAAFAHEVPQTRDAYPVELAGAVNLATPTIVDTLAVVRERYGKTCLQLSEDGADDVRLWRNVMFHAMRLKTAQPHLRQMHIQVSLHAAFRRDRQRTFEANDIYDFWHAGAAVAYADAFFTERDLRHLVCADRLDKLYSCRAVSRSDDAITVVRELVGEDSTADLK